MVLAQSYCFMITLGRMSLHPLRIRYCNWTGKSYHIRRTAQIFLHLTTICLGQCSIFCLDKNLTGLATRTPLSPYISFNFWAKESAFSPPFNPGTWMMVAPVAARRNLTASIPRSVSWTRVLASFKADAYVSPLSLASGGSVTTTAGQVFHGDIPRYMAGDPTAVSVHVILVLSRFLELCKYAFSGAWISAAFGILCL